MSLSKQARWVRIEEEKVGRDTLNGLTAMSEMAAEQKNTELMRLASEDFKEMRGLYYRDKHGSLRRFVK